MMYGIVFETSVFVRPPENDKSAFQNPPFADSFRKSAFQCPKMLFSLRLGGRLKRGKQSHFFKSIRVLVEVALFEWSNLRISSQKLELTHDITDFENKWLNYQRLQWIFRGNTSSLNTKNGQVQTSHFIEPNHANENEPELQTFLISKDNGKRSPQP